MGADPRSQAAMRRSLLAELKVVTGANPAAGAEASITVPGGVVWIVYSFMISLTTSAVVGTRVPGLLFDDGSTVFLRVATSNGQNQGGTGFHGWVTDLGAGNNTSGSVAFLTPLPRIFLLPGFRLRTSTVNLDPGDDYAAPILYVREVDLTVLDQSEVAAAFPVG